MRHILGMAKRHLDLRGAKAPKLELDFLRLAYAVQHIRGRGEEAKGYLLVVTPELAARARKWIEKYEVGDAVDILVGELSEAEREDIEAEVRRNIDGMIRGSQGESVEGASLASAGALAEGKLAASIAEREPDLAEVPESAPRPFGIRWDFCGTSAGRRS